MSQLTELTDDIFDLEIVEEAPAPIADPPLTLLDIRHIWGPWVPRDVAEALLDVMGLLNWFEEDVEAEIRKGLAKAAKRAAATAEEEGEGGNTSAAARRRAAVLARLSRPGGRSNAPRMPRMDPLSLLRKPVISLSVESDIARVIAVRGREVVAWGSINLDGDTPERQGIQTQGFADMLKELVGELPVQNGRLITDLPLYASLLRHFGISNVKGKFMEQVVQNETLDSIPFAPDEVDIKWRVRRDSQKGQEALAIAVSKDAVDQQVRKLQDAGVRPAAAYPKAIPLTYATDEENGIVVHLERLQASIVLVLHREPLAVHQVDLDQNISLLEQAEVVAEAVEQVGSYYEAFESEEEGLTLPVVITGGAGRQNALGDAVEALLGREVIPFTPPFDCPEHFPRSEYAINLGLVLADRVGTDSNRLVTRHGKPALNVLSDRHYPPPWPVRPILVFLAFVAFGTASFSATQEVNSIALRSDMLTTQLGKLKDEERTQRLNIARGNVLENQLEVTSVENGAMESRLANLDQAMNVLLERVETITAEARPDGVLLASSALQSNGFSLGGSALTYQQVFQYAANLRESEMFSEVKILQTARSSGLLEGTFEADDARPVTFQIKAVTNPGAILGVDEDTSNVIQQLLKEITPS